MYLFALNITSGGVLTAIAMDLIHMVYSLLYFDEVFMPLFLLALTALTLLPSNILYLLLIVFNVMVGISIAANHFENIIIRNKQKPTVWLWLICITSPWMCIVYGLLFDIIAIIYYASVILYGYFLFIYWLINMRQLIECSDRMQWKMQYLKLQKYRVIFEMERRESLFQFLNDTDVVYIVEQYLKEMEALTEIITDDNVVCEEYDINLDFVEKYSASL